MRSSNARFQLDKIIMGHLYDDFTPSTRILQGFAFLCKLGLFYLNLAGIDKSKYERKNEKDSGPSSKMTPSYKNFEFYLSSEHTSRILRKYHLVTKEEWIY